MEVMGQLHASAGLLPGKEPPVSIEQGAGWAPEPVWTFRTTNFFAPPWHRTPHRPAYSLLSVPTAVSELTMTLVLRHEVVSCSVLSHVFIVCAVNIIQILTAPTKAQFFCYVFYV